MEPIGIPFPPKNVRPQPLPPFDDEGMYSVTPKFLEVIKKVPDCPDRTVFKYRELCAMLSQYLLMQKDKFFDNRNIKIAHVANDPLGIAFNVTIFHRTQVITLLRNQVFAVPASSFMILRSGKVLPKYFK